MTFHYFIQDARAVYPEFLGLPAPERRKKVSDLGRHLRRRLVERYEGASLKHLKEVTEPFGKPYFIPSLWQVTTSHCGPWVVVAASKSWAVGVDIEKIDAKRVKDSLANFFMHPQEFAIYKALDCPCEKVNFFFKVWCRKEALLKAWGKGLSYPLKTLNVAQITVPISLGGRYWKRVPLWCGVPTGYCLECYQEVNKPFHLLIHSKQDSGLSIG